MMTPNAPTQRRVVLVTGAARGQGLAIVRRLVATEVDVVACDVLETNLRSSMAEFPPDRVLVQPLDVTSSASWDAAVQAIMQRFGRLDGLVNNAGALHRALLEDEDPDDFERAWRVNCFGPFLGIQACLPLLRLADSPSIVNTVSTAGLRPYPRHAGYASSKFAFRGLSLAAAAELGSEGIRVNSVMPGPVATPMHDVETHKRLGGSALLGRSGEADEIAAAVVFLLSDDASYFLGAEVVVDGGQLLKVRT